MTKKEKKNASDAAKRITHPEKEEEWILFFAICDSIHDFLSSADRASASDNPMFLEMVEALIKNFNERFVALTDISDIEGYILETINKRIPEQNYNDTLIELLNSQAIKEFEDSVNKENNIINTVSFTLNSVLKDDKTNQMFLLQQQIYRVVHAFFCQNDDKLIPVYMIDSSGLSSDYYCYNTKCGITSNDNKESRSELLIGNSSLFDIGSRSVPDANRRAPTACRCNLFKEDNYSGSVSERTRSKKKVMRGDVGTFMDRTIGLYGYNKIHNIREEVIENNKTVPKWHLKINDNVVNFDLARTRDYIFTVNMLSSTLDDIATNLNNKSPDAIKDTVKTLLFKLSKIYYLPIGVNNTVIQSPRRQPIGELTAERKHEIVRYLLDLKRSGDWLQVLSCYVGNNDTTLNKKYRFIFVSNDQSAIAFARYMNVPAILTKYYTRELKLRKDLWFYRPLKTDPKPYIAQTTPSNPTELAPASVAATPKSRSSVSRKKILSTVSPVAASASSAAGGAGPMTPQKTPARTATARPVSAAPVFSPRRFAPPSARPRPIPMAAFAESPERPMTTRAAASRRSVAAPIAAAPPVAPSPGAAAADRGLDTPVPREFLADLMREGVLTAPYWDPILRNGYTLTLFDYIVLRTGNDLLFAKSGDEDEAEAHPAARPAARRSSASRSV